MKTICKRDAEVVRYVMGVGGEKNKKSGPPAMFAAKGIYDEKISQRPLLGVESVLKRGFQRISDGQDEYLEAIEKWAQAKAGLESNSYASGVADLSSIMAASTDGSNSQYLEMSRKFALTAQEALSKIVELLGSA
jgi:hypothetical protein